MTRTGTALLDLFLRAECAGCGASAGPIGACTACLASLRTRPAPARPVPAPVGLPPCVAVGSYEGDLRALILAYKERGHRRLVGPLGDALAAAVTVAVPGVRATVLVPVPGTAAAARARQGDHMRRLARRAARRLRASGRPTLIAVPARARPRPDSAHLGRAARVRASRDAFAIRPRRLPPLRAAVAAGAAIILLDDVLTTGATLTALATCLAAHGVPIAAAATVAATRKHARPPRVG